MSYIQRTLGRLLVDAGQKMMDGNCGYSDEELLAITHAVFHQKVYMRELEHELGVSRRTIERWCHDELLPPLREDENHHKYLWRDELEEWRMTHRIQP